MAGFAKTAGQFLPPSAWMNMRDSLIEAAAESLAKGDPISALRAVALRSDAPGLALRGISMAQLGEFAKARVLLRSAARAFGSGEVVARARCIVAEAEVALAMRDLRAFTKTLEIARKTLERHGDRLNATHARQIELRRLLLMGHLEEAERLSTTIDPVRLPAPLKAVHELAVAAIAMRHFRVKAAKASLLRAQQAAQETGIAALLAEVESALEALDAPVARLIANGQSRMLSPAGVETLLRSPALIVDQTRYLVRQDAVAVSLARRPVLLALARVLAEAWPADAPREVLLARAFGAKLNDESHRVRLRVEIARLRRTLRRMTGIAATERGFRLVPARASTVVVLARPVESEHPAVLALLADGESWSSSALAMALGTSQRTVQRALDTLAAAGKIQALGRGRARRWMTPSVPSSVTALLLPPFAARQIASEHGS